MKVHTVSDKVRFIEKAFGRGRLAGNAKNIEVWCPACAPRDRSKKKLAIRIDDDANHCWSCGWKARNLLPLLLKFGTQDDAQEYVETFLPKSDREKRNHCIIIDVSGEKRELRLPTDFRMLAVPDGPFDPDHLAIQKYVTLERNVSERDMWYFKLGSSNEAKWWRRVLMPSFDATGRLNYIVGRAVDRRSRKYDAPAIDKLSIIFNEINIDWKKPLVLCEGPFDLINCGDNSVPLLGSDLNEQSLLFERIILNKTPCLVALDADMLHIKVPRLARKLQEYDIDVRVVDVSSYGKDDPGDMSKEEFQDAVGNARSVDWLMFITSKLNRASKTSLSIR